MHYFNMFRLSPLTHTCSTALSGTKELCLNIIPDNKDYVLNSSNVLGSQPPKIPYINVLAKS